MAGAAHFSPAMFDFLRDLKHHNNREWFQKNRSRYERDVRDPALKFVADAAPGLRAISTHLVADPRPVGGSLFRINRDIRFAADKSPYKTNVGLGFGHDRAKSAAAPGFYLHLEPGEAWAGGGIHMADGQTLARIRDAIVADSAGWGKLMADKRFAPMAVNMGESLKRAPQGYDPSHPHIEDLKRKGYVWHSRFSENDVCARTFLDQYLSVCRTAAPYMRFLARAVGAAW